MGMDNKIFQEKTCSNQSVNYCEVAAYLLDALDNSCKYCFDIGRKRLSIYKNCLHTIIRPLIP